MQLAIKSSFRLAVLLVLLHAIAAFMVFAVEILPAVKMVLFISILSSLFYWMARDALLLLPGSWHKISFEQDSVSVVTRGGADLSGKVSGSTTVSPYFIVLHLKLESRRLPVSRAIFPDALDTGKFRELCVRLRFAQ